ncbi:hypothetical protein E4T47_01817 [Aureobasidium subglaciale]|nr:hypothetical protein E4T47_01817 [Aureobasidium subglaciale]
MDPSVVAGDAFGQLWKSNLPGNFQGIGAEQIFSQPLVYTSADGIQYVYIATTQNNLYKINAKTGDIVTQRNMHVPFLTADLDGCVDINPTVGVTATGVIDPDTGIWYLTSKTYSDAFQNGAFSKANPPGRLNGRYYFHAINTADLSEVSGFPRMIDGLVFRNNPNRMFIGGNQHARPGMLQVGDFIYTGWASHCVKWNFTGAVIGFHRSTGAVVEAFAMEGGPEPNTIPGAGVWMSGGGLAYDGKGSMFLASGNGYASQLKATGNSLPGRQPPTSLEEAAVNFAIGSDGKLTPVDFFMPWEKTQLDGADKDLGTSPLELLPTDVFKCANVARMGVVTGKSGKTYWLNLDNLGGYQMGPNKLDAAVQVYQNENSVYAGAGVMPLGGGYIYINVIQYQTHVFKFSCSASGDPQFTLVANTPEKNAYILGVGHGTTTSLNGQEGTGLLWTTDVEGFNLRIYNAIPTDGGSMQLLKSFNIPGVTKFSRPVFGNGIAYVGTTQGALYAFGSPVNLPLNCSSPYTFANTPVGKVSDPVQITCKANIGVTVSSVALTGNPNFKADKVATPLTLTAGQTFSFNATFAPNSVGLLSSDILVNTTNNVAKYSTTTPITLKGTANSLKPLLAIAPNTVSFNVIAGQQVGGTSQSSLFSNRGDTVLTIGNITYSIVSETGPWITPNVTDNGIQVGYFTFTNLPTTIDPNNVATVNINYNPDVAGNHAVYVKVNSDGGSSLLDVVGRAGTNPSALIEFQTPDGTGWVTYQPGVPFSFGNVTENQTKNLKMRVTNNGTGSAVPLSLTVSKPPYGIPGIIGAVNTIDLAEGTLLQANESQTATLFCSVPRSQVNVPSFMGTATWTINTGDPNMGKQVIQFTCSAIAEQVGPLLTNGTAQFSYVGCFKENNPGRQLATNPINSKTLTNDICITKCATLGYRFAGSQYIQECWCGNALPLQMDLDTDCNFNCAGNENQTCGGNGNINPGSHISLFADLARFDGNTTTQVQHIVPSYNGYNYLGCYAESGGKTVSAASQDTGTMTVEACGDFCIAKGYTLFGLQYASQCWCGNSIATTSKLTIDSKCNMACKGSNAEFCGAGSLTSLYGKNMTAASSSSSSTVVSSSSASSIVVSSSSSTVASPPPSSSSGTATTATSITASSSNASPTAVPTSILASYTYMGCFNETHDRRALNGPSKAGNTNTLESCATFCAGYAYFGVEFGQECYCGASLYANSILQKDESGCSVACAGNSAQKCGGGDYLNVYYTNVTTSSTTTSAPTSTTTGPITVQSVGGYTHLGCYNELANGRALNQLNKAGSSVSVTFCASYCSAYTYFGIEYGQECYCGNTIASGSAPVADGRCKMPCAGNATEICGGSSGLNMYQKAAIVSGSSALSSSPASSSVLSSSATGSSVLSSSASSSSVLSSSSSSSAALSSTTSSASDSVSSGSTSTTGSTSSSSSVSSSASSSTASSSIVSSTISSTSSASATPTGPVAKQSVGDYVYQGCWSEIGGRALQGKSFSNSSNSLEFCATFCAGYTYWASEYSSECYCSNIISSASVLTKDGRCNMPCSADKYEICGGSNGLSLYKYSPGSGSSSGSSSPSSPSTSVGPSSSPSSSVPSSSSSVLSSSSTISSATSATDSRLWSSTVSSSSILSQSSSSALDFVLKRALVKCSFLKCIVFERIVFERVVFERVVFERVVFERVVFERVVFERILLLTFGHIVCVRFRNTNICFVYECVVLLNFVERFVFVNICDQQFRLIDDFLKHFSELNKAHDRTHCIWIRRPRVLQRDKWPRPGCRDVEEQYRNDTCYYAWFGVENALECYCGPYPRAGSSLLSDNSTCNMPCPGDKTALCGAGNRLNMYYSSNSTKASTDPMNVNATGNYSFYSCYKDSPRALSVVSASDTMSVDACLKLAEAGKYTWAGLEYSRECWLGNALASGTGNATASECNMPCKGMPGQLCGAGSRLSLYNRNTGS